MPHFDIVRKATPSDTFRVKSVMGMYDMTTSAVEEHFEGDLELPDEWTIGLIVGRSGSGKTTIARELFGDYIVDGFDWTHESIVDDMPRDASMQDITRVLTSVGFASPPSWLKPYSVLSNGEKMRCDLARAILEKRDFFVFDEFTSVVDRNVARVGSFAMQKALRKMGGGRKFVAVTCHADVEEWLMPDWVFNTDTMTFSTKDLEEQKKNRPRIKLDIIETKRKREYWAMFSKYHYLAHNFNTAARVFVAFADGVLCGFSSVLPLPHPSVKNIWKFHRTVVFPDYQGIGVASAMRDCIADEFLDEGRRITTVTSNRAMIESMRRDPRWVCGHIGRLKTYSTTGIMNNYRTNESANRITASWEYLGDKNIYRRGEDAAREAIPLTLSPAEQQIVDNLSK